MGHMLNSDKIDKDFNRHDLPLASFACYLIEMSNKTARYDEINDKLLTLLYITIELLWSTIIFFVCAFCFRDLYTVWNYIKNVACA